ncbi:hypothetical protein FV226_24340 [Methylobacterium sp. WL12]|uniref:hypothetical protein n=1 Tax=Methylobacterium sp. WL12 TaxID=2603890 RepID=UPI0011CAABB4|nr:hypothetical protein [Methylobacterium sp. WL12]TXM65878.1 hypothetical protein FV226_24340 [Methylobacterium sp. WL12]
MIPLANQWGPFHPRLDPSERLLRLRTLHVIARLLCGHRAETLIDALSEAEATETALPTALAAVDRLDALDRRKILGTYAAITKRRGA